MSKRSSRSCASGFTLVEILVATSVTLAISAAAMTLALSGRRIYEADRARTDLNQNIRVSKDFIVTDIRQAGERLSNDFPAMEIIDGAAGAPDILVVRRNMNDTVLLLCKTLKNSNKQLHVADEVAPVDNPWCVTVPDGDGDGMPDNVQRWREHRLAAGGKVRAYVYDPVNEVGEFFTYSNENYVPGTKLIVRAQLGHAWQNTYPVANQCRVYILEERRYEIVGDVLRMIIDGDTANPASIVDGITDFQAVAVFSDGSTQNSLTVADNWFTLRGIDVTLDGQVTVDGESIDRRWSSEILPRNLMSQ